MPTFTLRFLNSEFNNLTFKALLNILQEELAIHGDSDFEILDNDIWGGFATTSTFAVNGSGNYTVSELLELTPYLPRINRITYSDIPEINLLQSLSQQI